jgi:hypothetical protein
MQQMSAKIQQQIIEWRRAKVMEMLLSKVEDNQSEIARILQVYKSIVCMYGYRSISWTAI